MSARDWVIDKLQRARAERVDLLPLTIALAGDCGFTVRRPDMPDAHVYCPDGIQALLTKADLDRAVAAFPAVQFVVVFRDGAANDAYPHAERIGVALGRVGELQTALSRSRDISKFVPRERQYVAQRLNTSGGVQAWQRVGENAYRITRTALTPATLMIATFDTYEATADQIHSILERYAELALDVIVATNPSTSGLANAASETAHNAGVKLMIMREFTSELTRSWNA